MSLLGQWLICVALSKPPEDCSALPCSGLAWRAAGFCCECSPCGCSSHGADSILLPSSLEGLLGSVQQEVSSKWCRHCTFSQRNAYQKQEEEVAAGCWKCLCDSWRGSEEAMRLHLHAELSREKSAPCLQPVQRGKGEGYSLPAGWSNPQKR